MSRNIFSDNRAPHEPTFAAMLRACRLGWRYCARHGCFIRIADEGRRNIIELAPPQAVPSKCATKYFRAWWEGDLDLAELLPWLKPIRRIKRHIVVDVDDDGNIITYR